MLSRKNPFEKVSSKIYRYEISLIELDNEIKRYKDFLNCEKLSKTKIKKIEQEIERINITKQRKSENISEFLRLDYTSIK
jgi:hypothetical protein|tara:strand:+ start:9836 stop:10075 length:240 start_codon:yes stop_codon:yes gene_type:complete